MESDRRCLFAGQIFHNCKFDFILGAINSCTHLLYALAVYHLTSLALLVSNNIFIFSFMTRKDCFLTPGSSVESLILLALTVFLYVSFQNYEIDIHRLFD